MRRAALGSACLLLFALLSLAGDQRPQPEISFARTPARLARGKYLVDNLIHCFDCHSEKDARGDVIPAMRGAGHVLTMQESDVPAPHFLVCPNITPDRETGAGNWTDAQFVRALREGVGHDGRVLVPLMPYWNLRNLTDEDLASVIVYVRSIPAVRHALPKRNLRHDPLAQDWRPGAQPQPLPPDAPAQVRRGEYLVHLGNCSACHTPVDSKRQPIPGLLLAGGRIFARPWGTVATANLTPDASGIAYYDEAMFLRTLRTGHAGARALNPTMPWKFFRHLNDDDLRAIFAYLRTIPPVQHRVDNTEPPTLCPKDGNRHGYGDRN